MNISTTIAYFAQKPSYLTAGLRAVAFSDAAMGSVRLKNPRNTQCVVRT